MSVEVGSPAPPFSLPTTEGDTTSLTDLTVQGPAVLVFFPFAFTGICTGELCEIRDNISAFADANAQVVGISCDSPHTQKAFAQQEKIPFPLLSDFWPHGMVSNLYGVFNSEGGRAERATFIIDSEGIVRWSVVNPVGQARNLENYRSALAALSA